MPSRIKPLLIHAAHLAVAAAVAALLGWLGTNQAQIVAAIPPHYQGIALTAFSLFAAFKYQSGGKP